MSGLLPNQTITAFRGFSDLAVDLYGIECTLYVPTNLTALEPNDAYTNTADITYRKYDSQKVWIKWASKDLHRLRKLGVFSENETPIIAYFKNFPEVTIQSYIKVSIEYIPGTFNTDEFEIVDLLMKGTYGSEILKPVKLAPRRAKNRNI